MSLPRECFRTHFYSSDALKGDNVVDRSENMPWYKGPPLLTIWKMSMLDQMPIMLTYVPVQWVIRPHSDKHHDFRGFAGRVAGGVFKVGDEVGTTIRFNSKISKGTEEVDEAFHPSVTILLKMK